MLIFTSEMCTVVFTVLFLETFKIGGIFVIFMTIYNSLSRKSLDL